MKKISLYKTIAKFLQKGYPCFLPLSDERYDLLVTINNVFQRVLIKPARISRDFPVVDIGTSFYKDKKTVGALYNQDDYDILIAYLSETGDFWMFNREDVPDVGTIHLGKKYDSFRLIPQVFTQKEERKSREIVQEETTTAMMTVEEKPEPSILREDSKKADEEIQDLLSKPDIYDETQTNVDEVLDEETKDKLMKLYSELEDDQDKVE